jgi:hypothetical protein
MIRKYQLNMNPLKCAFGVFAGKFLRFIVHEKGIEVDPKKIESIEKVGEPVCKHNVQKHLGKINYLHRFIANLAGKVNLFLPLILLMTKFGKVGKTTLSGLPNQSTQFWQF